MTEEHLSSSTESEASEEKPCRRLACRRLSLWDPEPKANLYKALSQAQGELEGAKKTAKNEHFRSKYTRLEDVIEAIREPFKKYGLGFHQDPGTHMVGSVVYARVRTTIFHESGESVSSELSLPVSKPDAQGVGSAITYARRYALLGMAGIAPEDDDGEAAVGRPAQSQKQNVAAVQAARSEAEKAIKSGNSERMKEMYRSIKETDIPKDEQLAILKQLGDEITKLKNEVLSNGRK